MQTLSEIKDVLSAHGLSPKKAMGQNFLCDHNLIRKLVDRAGVSEGELVLEVGPGTGVLTDELIERSARVIACEMDDGLAQIMRERFGDRITLIHGDCLETKRAINEEIARAIGGDDFKLVANLPYSAATPLMLTLAIDYPNCRGMYVTVQKEVAERLRAHPRTKAYGEVSVIAQALCEVERVATLPPHCFWPRPKVTSEMIGLDRRASPMTDEPRALAEGVHRLFAERRKQIGRLFDEKTELPAGVERTMRAEALTVEQAVRLSRRLARD